MTFLYDHRNLGGRESINRYMHMHKIYLKDFNPTIVIKSPKDHVDKNKPKKNLMLFFLRDRKYSMVRNTYNTIYCMKKGIVDDERPKTYFMKYNLVPAYRDRLTKFTMEQHNQNLYSLEKKKFDIKNFSDRWKNPQDFFVHPALFLRPRKSPNFVYIKYNNIHYVPPYFYKFKGSSKKQKPQQYKQYKRMSRPQSAKILKHKTNLLQSLPIYPPPSQLWVKKNIKEEAFNSPNQQELQSPEKDKIASMYLKYYKTNSNSFVENKDSVRNQQYNSTKRELLDKIIENRIYRTLDLQEFFNKSRPGYNFHDDNIWNMIKTEIISDLDN